MDPRRGRHKGLCKLHDARRHGCGEKRELVILRGLCKQGLHILDKAHLEHLVRLVEDDLVHAAESERPAPYMIKQPSRRADDELRMSAQLLLLSLDVRTTVDDNRADSELRPKRLGHVCNLDRKLACGCNDKCLRDLALRFDLLKQGQKEGERLARARLCLCDDIAPRTHGRDCLLLHGGRRGNPLFFEQCTQRLRDTELVKMRHDESTSAPVSVMRMVFSHCAESV